MFRKDDVVVRLSSSMEGDFKKGTRAIVKEIINDTEFTLEGHRGIYLQSSFRLVGANETLRENRQVSDLESVENALNVIDAWNRTHPTGYMISIEAHPAQDGGSTFLTNTLDTNSVSQFMVELAKAASGEERKATLKKAMELMQLQMDNL